MVPDQLAPRPITIIVSEGGIRVCQAIALDGEAWLVAEWMKHKTKPLSRPARIVRLTGLEIEQPADPHLPLLLRSPVPKALFDLSIAPEALAGFVVRDRPDVMFDLSKRN